MAQLNSLSSQCLCNCFIAWLSLGTKTTRSGTRSRFGFPVFAATNMAAYGPVVSLKTFGLRLKWCLSFSHATAPTCTSSWLEGWLKKRWYDTVKSTNVFMVRRNVQCHFFFQLFWKLDCLWNCLFSSVCLTFHNSPCRTSASSHPSFITGTTGGMVKLCGVTHIFTKPPGLCPSLIPIWASVHPPLLDLSFLPTPGAV